MFIKSTVTRYCLNGGLHVGDAGASALAAALDRGALPRLEVLWLSDAAIGNAGLVRGWWPSRRPCGGGPRWRWSISVSVATRLATRASPPSWSRRHQTCRCAAAADGRTEEAQGAQPRLHPGLRRRVCRPRHRARQRRAASARASSHPSGSHPRQRCGEASCACGTGEVESRSLFSVEPRASR